MLCRAVLATAPEVQKTNPFLCTSAGQRRAGSIFAREIANDFHLRESCGGFYA